MRAVLRLCRRQQRAAWFLRGRPFPDLVFPSLAGTTRDDAKIRKAVLAIVKKAKVRRRRSLILRHTFGSLLIQQSESLVYLRDQMGHASIQVDDYDRRGRAALTAPAAGRTIAGSLMEPPLTDPNALKVLQVIRERATDGYTVMTRAGVKPEELSKALMELHDRGCVSIKGDPRPDRVGETYLSVPPSALGYVDFLLGRVRFSSMR